MARRKEKRAKIIDRQGAEYRALRLVSCWRRGMPGIVYMEQLDEISREVIQALETRGMLARNKANTCWHITDAGAVLMARLRNEQKERANRR